MAHGPSALRLLPITMDVSFCVSALEETLARFGGPEIFSTDQGSQPRRVLNRPRGRRVALLPTISGGGGEAVRALTRCVAEASRRAGGWNIR